MESREIFVIFISIFVPDTDCMTLAVAGAKVLLKTGKPRNGM
jgi:hypothetical protein